MNERSSLGHSAPLTLRCPCGGLRVRTHGVAVPADGGDAEGCLPSFHPSTGVCRRGAMPGAEM